MGIEEVLISLSKILPGRECLDNDSEVGEEQLIQDAAFDLKAAVLSDRDVADVSRMGRQARGGTYRDIRGEVVWILLRGLALTLADMLSLVRQCF